MVIQRTTFSKKCILFFSSFLFVTLDHTEATVEGGALLKGSSLSNNSSVIPEANAGSSLAIKWSSTDMDPGVFDFNASTPTRLKVKSAGDYFLSFTGPISENVKTADKRSQVHFFAKKNGSAIIQTATARSTYIRHDSGHTESSGHMHLLIPALSANDYIEIFAKSFDNATQNSVKIGTATLFLEKIAPARTIFSATATRTVAGTDLNPDTASQLQWTQEVADSGYTHSNSSNSHNITLANSGKYLVFANVPLSNNRSRASPQLIPKIDGVQVSGGFAAQGYVRNADATSKSSVHWVGLIQTASANKILTFELSKRAASGSLVVPTNEKASVFIEKLSNASNLFSATATQLSSGDNWNVGGEVKWATQETIDSAKFTHSTSSNAHQVSVDADGDYLLMYTDGLTSSVARANPKMVVRVNGNGVSGAEVSSHYIRNASGHNHSSGALVTSLNGLKANDVVTVGVTIEASSGNVDEHVPARLVLVKKPTLPAPVFTIAQTSGSSPISASVTFKQDGSNVTVTGFTESDINATNATISNFAGSGHTYTFNIVPTTYPAIINLSIPSGAAVTAGGSQTGSASALTQFRNLVTDDSSLLLYLPFDEGTGTITKDRSSSGLDGTLFGDPTWVAGKRGYALEFDGTGDQVNVESFRGVTGTGPITIALWFKSTSNSPNLQNIVGWGVNAAGTRYNFVFESGRVRLDNAGGSNKTNSTYADGLWHHAVVVKPNNGKNNSTFYVDGSSVTKTGDSITSQFNIGESTNFTIGGDRTGAGRVNFIGSIDDFRLYSKELNASAITAMYANGAGEGYYTPTIPVFTVDNFANASPVPVSVTFKRGGYNLGVTGFAPNDISVSGGLATNFASASSGAGGHTYTFNITPTSFPSTITITIPKGAAAGGGGVYQNDVVSKTFQASYPATLSTNSLGDVEMWYDASDLNADGTTDSNYSSGNAVHAWSDKSGNAYHLTKAGDPSWSSQNGLGVVNFDGDDAYYSDNEWGGRREFTMFSISRYTHSTDHRRVISDRTHNWIFGYHGANMNKWHFNAWLTDNPSQIGRGWDTNFHLHVASMNSNDQGNTFFDGTRVGNVNGGGAHNSNYLPRKLQFGGYQTNTEFSKCEVAEFIAFDRVLNAYERLAIEGYLANKWGISHQLPLDHANRDLMAGIGRGLSAEINATSPTQAYPIPVTVTFKKNGSNHAVSNFANDFTTSFKPSTISDLELWLDASDTSSLSHSSNAVSIWQDKSGNGYEAVQSTVANRPTTGSTSTNSLNTLSFDGTDDGLDLARDVNKPAINLFVLLKGHGYLLSNNGTERTAFFDAGSGRKLYWHVNNVSKAAGSAVTGYSDSAYQIHEYSLNGGLLTLRVNGIERFQSSNVTGNLKVDRIGLKWTGTTSVPTWTGEIGEIIAVGSTAQRSKIEGYLAHK